MLVIDATTVERILTPDIALDLVGKSMRALTGGDAVQIVRQIMPIPGTAGALGVMPGSLAPDGVFGVKCTAVFPPAQTGLPSHQGCLVLFDGRRGEPIALIEAGRLTAIRTAAATAHATRHLARSSSRTLGIFGAGEQAQRHIVALLRVLPFTRIMIWARDLAKSERFAANVVDNFECDASACLTAQEAASADVICTLTAATEPVLRGDWVRRGAHVNLVGSSGLQHREVDDELVVRSKYFVDSLESARMQAAEFLSAMHANRVCMSHMLGEIGAVAAGLLPGRRSDDDITVYKSLGNIAQDLACGRYLYDSAVKEGFGVRVKLR